MHEKIGGMNVLRVWIPALPHDSIANRVLLHFAFIFSSLFALPFVGRVDVVWSANPNLFSFFPSSVYGFVKGVPIVRNVDDLWPEVFYDLGYVNSNFIFPGTDILIVSLSCIQAIKTCRRIKKHKRIKGITINAFDFLRLVDSLSLDFDSKFNSVLSLTCASCSISPYLFTV